MKTLNMILLAAVIAATPACKKKKDEPNTAGSGQTMGSSNMGSATPEGSGSAGSGSAMGSAEGSGSAAMGSAAGSGEGSAAMAGSGSAAPADPNADYITVLATHKEKKPTDPVEVKFEKYSVVKANFDPKKIEGGSATIELDLTSLKTGSEKRDAHLQSPDYLNVPKFAKVTIDISNVKKKADKTYTATAKVKAVGVDKTYPVTFDVVDATDDSIKIKGEHNFKRTDFKVGKDPKDEKESVANDLTIKMQLTLKKT
ncbi:MAG TPA: YceI family protein [Kofleriaceae bacterium]|nr:YceI family protein [Kofleriaceae bacterium]